MPIDVRTVASRSELKQFIELPFRLYRNQPLWAPPLIFERKRFLDRSKNPFFVHGEGEYFVAYRDGNPVGRITAQIDRDLNEHQGNDWGLFGFFECEDDPEAAAALFDAADSWLRERGMGRMVGPMDFSMNDECGVMVEGFETRPLIKQSWHPPFYQRLFERAGFVKAMDLFMWNLEVEDRTKVLPIIFDLAEQLEPRHGIKLRHIRKADLDEEMRRFVDIYNAAWKDNWGFVPMRVDEMAHTAKELKPLIDENWLMVAETAEGETVGAAFTFPDFNQVLKKIGGRLLPFGWFRALRNFKKIDRVRVGWLGVKPEYQHTGVAAAFYVEHFDMAAKTPQTGGEMGWILESNVAMNKGMEAMGGRIVKRYRMFERPFDGPPTAAPAAADEPSQIDG